VKKIIHKIMITSVGIVIGVGTNTIIESKSCSVNKPENTIYVVNQSKAAYNSVISEIDNKIEVVEEEKEEEPSSVKKIKKKNKKKKTKKQVNAEEVKQVSVDVSYNSELGSQIVDFAIQFNGNPYVSGGTSLTNGADCSGFVQSVFANFGISLSRTSRDQSKNGSYISIDNIKPGDLIFYGYDGYISHVAIYIGNGQIIHAMTPSEGIGITSYNFGMPIITSRRIVS